VEAAFAAREAAAEVRLRAAVMALPADARRRLAPALSHAVLRRLLQALTNGGGADGGGGGGGAGAGGAGGSDAPATAGAPPDEEAAAAAAAAASLAAWAANPRVIEMLAAAARALRRGEVSEEDLEAALLGQIAGGGDLGRGAESGQSGQSGGGGGGAAPPNCVVLPPHLLVEALNEHVGGGASAWALRQEPPAPSLFPVLPLSPQHSRAPHCAGNPPRQLEERRAGDAAQRRGDATAALGHYARAAAVLSFVRGSGPEDAAEVASCRARLALAEAGARIALEQWGATARACGEGLAALRGAGPATMGGGGEAPGGGASGGSLDPELEASLLARRAEALLARDEAEVGQGWGEGEVGVARLRPSRLAPAPPSRRRQAAPWLGLALLHRPPPPSAWPPWQAAAADVATAEGLDPFHPDLPRLREAAAAARRRGRGGGGGGGSGIDGALAARMLGLGIGGGGRGRPRSAAAGGQRPDAAGTSE
jgi:hypothetical protein